MPQGEQLRQEFAAADASKVRTCITHLLRAPHKVCQLSKLKLGFGGSHQLLAISILTELGAIKKVAWKPESQRSGYPAAFIVKNFGFAGPTAELKFANFIRDVAEVAFKDFKTETVPNEFQMVVQLQEASIAPMTAAKVESFSTMWLPRLKPSSSSTENLTLWLHQQPEQFSFCLLLWQKR